MMLFPFFSLAIFATHSRAEIFSLPPPLWFGSHSLENFTTLFKKLDFVHHLSLSFYIALISCLLTMLIASMAGFALAFYEFRFKNWVFSIILAMMMLPPFLSMIPTFVIINSLHWVDEPRALYIPAAASAFGVYLIRQFALLRIPIDIIEAARMDGASEWRIYRQIALPMLKPALSVLGLVTFITSWNNFISALVVMRSTSSFTVPLALRSLQLSLIHI